MESGLGERAWRVGMESEHGGGKCREEDARGSTVSNLLWD